MSGATAGGATAGEAVAEASALRAAELSPQEMAFTLEAIKAHLKLESGPAAERMQAALDEALATVARMIRQPNNEGLAAWCRKAASRVREEGDIAAFLDHMQAVLRLYGLIVYLPQPGAPSSEGSPSGSPG